ncbi:MAG: penicillin acylase family protein, partial [Lutimaribacter sp.]
MSLIFKWLVRIAGGILMLLIFAVLAVYYLSARSLPDYDATEKVAGIAAPVEILRDTANVPHILGQSDSDVFFGLGYAHAQDRLWQMVVMRRTAQGRLSEVFGLRTVETDKLLRRLDLYNLAQQSVAAQDLDTIAMLNAYAAGVNARLVQINKQALGRGAPEMFIFDMPVAPWTPADSLAILKLMALQLSDHLQTEVLRAQLSMMLPDARRLADILPDAPGSGVSALPAYSSLMPKGHTMHASHSPAQRPFLWPVPPRGMASASNAWAAAPQRSAAGGTLLANDPHLGLSAPTIWYLARLQLASGGVIGGTIPGMPLVLSGRSEDLGWALTSAYMDDQDVLLEQLNPENPEEYLTPEGYKPFATRPSIVEIKDHTPVTLTLRWSENGPILAGSDFDLAEITPKGHVASLGWTALSPADTSMTAGLRLMQAKTVQDALEGSALYIAPAQNLTVVDGVQIAMRTIGAMPRRDAAHQTQGRMPAPGWLAQNRWQGLFPASANPEFVNPNGGILGNTNNKTVERPFPL